MRNQRQQQSPERPRPDQIKIEPREMRPLSTSSRNIEELKVDWTTGKMKTPGVNNASALVVPATVHKQPSPQTSNATIRSGHLPNDHTIQRCLDDVSDEEDVADAVQCVEMAPAHVMDDLDAVTHMWVVEEDKEADRRLTELLPTDHLTFDWTSDHTTFNGVRETFTGTSGPTFDIDENTRPIDIFLKFCDDDFFRLITHQTNKHASQLIDRPGLTDCSRLNRFTIIDKGEMGIFLAILILQGLAPLTVEKEYWVENGHLTLKYFKDLMTYHRFVLIKRLLHFSDSSFSNDRDNLPRTSDEYKLGKIQPLLDFLHDKFKTLYLPGQDIAIDESLLKWQGRLSFAQKIATKAAKVGVKTYELCESATGYLWSFFVYTGKQSKQTDQINQTDEIVQINLTKDDDDTRQTDKPPLPTSVTAKIVEVLAKPLFNRGHTIIMDNFYNSPLLARYLKSQGTDCYGTLRVNRQFVPESIKSVAKNDLRTGEIVQSFCKDLHVMMWCDTNVVSMLSTYHEGKEKYGHYKYKPQMVLDYNLAMGGVDKKDQLLSSFPMERQPNQVWHKKVYRRLLNITILNSFIIYKRQHKKITQRDFRKQIAEDLIKIYKAPEVERPLKVTVERYVDGPKKRPILEGNHFICNGPTRYAQCVWCKKSRTSYICKECDVSLCLQMCFEHFHTIHT